MNKLAIIGGYAIGLIIIALTTGSYHEAMYGWYVLGFGLLIPTGACMMDGFNPSQNS